MLSEQRPKNGPGSMQPQWENSYLSLSIKKGTFQFTL